MSWNRDLLNLSIASAGFGVIIMAEHISLSRISNKTKKLALWCYPKLLAAFRLTFSLSHLTLKIVIGIAALLAYLSLRPEISVDPSISYDPREAFKQQFTITNNGPFSIREVHYNCAITKLVFNDPKAVNLTDIGIVVMFPLEPHLPELPWKGKTTTNCDFITLYGPRLHSLSIEIAVFYTPWPWPWEVSSGWKFTGRKDAAGNFQWEYGSAYPGQFDPPNGRRMIIIPWGTFGLPGLRP